MNPFHIRMQKRAQKERWRDPLCWQCVHMTADHTLQKGWNRGAENGTLSFQDSPWESNTLPHVWAGVWPSHRKTRVHLRALLLNMNSSLSQSEPRFLPTLMHKFSSCSTVISSPVRKNRPLGKKGSDLQALLYLLPPTFWWDEIASPGPRYGSTTAEKRREPNPSHRQQKQHCSLFSVTAHRERSFSVRGGHGVYPANRSPQMLTLLVAG